MKSNILLASENDLSSSIKLFLLECNNRSISISSPSRFAEVVTRVKRFKYNIVIINAQDNKLEALNLCYNLKQEFKGSIKAFVYISEANAHEGSKFGLLNAEVEDDQSIKALVDKVLIYETNIVIEENITSVLNLTGDSGASFVTLLLAYGLNLQQTHALVLETGNDFALKRYLNLDSGLALLSNDSGLEPSTDKDVEWFKTFLLRSEKFSGTFYLNLFNNYQDKMTFANCQLGLINLILKDLEDFQDQPINKKKITVIKESLRYLIKELDGSSKSLFNEIVCLGSKFAKNFFFDLGSDYVSGLNSQLLSFSKNLIILFKDRKNIAIQYKSFRDYIKAKYSLNIIPVVASDLYNYGNYTKLSKKKWTEILDEVPLVMPDLKESFMSLIYENDAIEPKVSKFIEQLLFAINANFSSSSDFVDKGILRFLHKKDRYLG